MSDFTEENTPKIEDEAPEWFYEPISVVPVILSAQVDNIRDEILGLVDTAGQEVSDDELLVELAENPYWKGLNRFVSDMARKVAEEYTRNKLTTFGPSVDKYLNERLNFLRGLIPVAQALNALSKGEVIGTESYVYPNKYPLAPDHRTTTFMLPGDKSPYDLDQITLTVRPVKSSMGASKIAVSACLSAINQPQIRSCISIEKTDQGDLIYVLRLMTPSDRPEKDRKVFTRDEVKHHNRKVNIMTYPYFADSLRPVKFGKMVSRFEEIGIALAKRHGGPGINENLAFKYVNGKK